MNPIPGHGTFYINQLKTIHHVDILNNPFTTPGGALFTLQSLDFHVKYMNETGSIFRVWNGLNQMIF